MNILDMREEIDIIDGKIAALLDRRLDICSRIGAAKKSENAPVMDIKREEEVKNRLHAFCSDTNYPYISDIYSAIIVAGRNVQK